MDNALTELLAKQTLIIEYLRKYYEIRSSDWQDEEEDPNATITIRDNWNWDIVYGENLEEEITNIFGFGKSLTETVIRGWAEYEGLEQSDEENWNEVWFEPKDINTGGCYGVYGQATNAQHIDYGIPQPIDQGRRRLQTSYNSDIERIDWQNGEAEMIRVLSEQIAIEINEQAASELLSSANTHQDLVRIMSHLGYDANVTMTDGHIRTEYVERLENYNVRMHNEVHGELTMEQYRHQQRILYDTEYTPEEQRQRMGEIRRQQQVMHEERRQNNFRGDNLL